MNESVMDYICTMLKKQDEFNSDVKEAIEIICDRITGQRAVNDSQSRVNWILWAFTFGVGYICVKNIAELRTEIEELKHAKGE